LASAISPASDSGAARAGSIGGALPPKLPALPLLLVLLPPSDSPVSASNAASLASVVGVVVVVVVAAAWAQSKGKDDDTRARTSLVESLHEGPELRHGWLPGWLS